MSDLSRHYLVVAKVWEKMEVRQRATNIDMESFSLKKLNDVEGKEQYQIKNSNKFIDLEN
jgi:hypothetical protein